ncbi:MAG: energy transducer TonB [Chitinophagales bacterium]|nr:energy transducer TonB [Chitinophagales bacterium]
MKTNYENTGMLDMVFENRNKTYGAYALRSDYNQRISRALIVSTSVVFMLCFGKLLSDKLKYNATKLDVTSCIFNLSEEVHLQDPIKIEPPKPVVQAQAQAIQSIRDVEMRVTAQTDLVDSMPPRDLLAMAEAGTTTNMNGNTVGEIDGHGHEEVYTVSQPVAQPVQPPVLNFAEIMPEYPGGEEALMKFVRNKTVYPDRERDLEIEGKALVRFVVNEDGSVSNISILRSDSKGFSGEGERVVAMLPKFKPGMQQGKPVRVQYILPFQFRLGR